MKVLVVGGGRFVGRHAVEALREAGARVTLFNRGNHAEAFPLLELIRGDRDEPEALEALRGRRWDAVLDTCAYRPEQVRSLLDALQGEPLYALVSSISVYAGGAADLDEDAPRHPPDHRSHEVTPETYGPLKVACEEVALRRAADRALILRPGVVVGPWDPTDRFSYWPARLARRSGLGDAARRPAGDDDAPEGSPDASPAAPRGEVLAPGAPHGGGARPTSSAVQWIDARDLASFAAARLTAGDAGRYNVVTPANAHTLGGLLTTCAEVVAEMVAEMVAKEAAEAGSGEGTGEGTREGSEEAAERGSARGVAAPTANGHSRVGRAGGVAALRWLDEDFLLERGVVPFQELPMWLPSGDDGMFRVRAERAAAAGLRCRDARATVRDTLAWLRARPEGLEPHAGMSAAREAELLRAWRERH